MVLKSLELCNILNYVAYSITNKTTIIMQFINTNRVKTAKLKLSQHRLQGQRSNLSIYQVAELMDALKIGDDEHTEQHNSVFFSLN